MLIPRLISGFFFLLSFYSLKAQQIQFERVLPPPPAPQIIADFAGFLNGSVAYADIDADGDIDILISGESGYADISTRLYLNDGNGNYVESANTPFTDLQYSVAAFADIDGDNDPDLLISGLDENYIMLFKLYLNDGSGNFTEQTGTLPFTPVIEGDMAFADVDADGDQDLLLTGGVDLGEITKLYINDGTGNFTEQTGTLFTPLYASSIEFFDADGDNDPDVLITGSNTSMGALTKLYINDGSGNFTEQSGTPFSGNYHVKIDIADINGDNFQDVLLTAVFFSRVYLNDGTGNFVEDMNIPFLDESHYHGIFSDIDGDNDEDVLITTNYGVNLKMYLNDGNGNFTSQAVEILLNNAYGDLYSLDVDNDNDDDLLMADSIADMLYINDGSGNFLPATGSPFTGVMFSAVDFADVDGDDDLDVMITGQTNIGISNQLYLNDGNGGYLPDFSFDIAGLNYDTVDFADIDGDGDQDMLLTGNYEAKLFLNDGAGNFTEQTSSGLTGVRFGAVDFADVDNDNDLDVFIACNSMSVNISHLYLNDGTGNFTLSNTNTFIDIAEGAVSFADMDGDADPDLLIAGAVNPATNYATVLYLNDGAGNFTEQTGTPFTGVRYAALAIADVDNDSDPDVLLAGTSQSNEITKLYLNDGNAHFTEDTGLSMTGVTNGSVVLADLDNDSDNDIMVSGFNGNGYEVVIQVLINDGTGNFSEETDHPFYPVRYSSIAVADIDGDYDKDVLLTGETMYMGAIAFLYRNTNTYTDIAQLGENSLVTLYPNPGHKIFKILSKDNNVEEIQVFNLEGQAVPFEFDKESLQLQLNLAPGIYIVQLQIDNQVYRQKIILN